MMLGEEEYRFITTRTQVRLILSPDSGSLTECFIVTAVVNIIRNHHKEEIRRRMSHGEILKLNTSDTSPATGLPPISPSSTSSSSSVLGDTKAPTTREEKPDYFKASVMVRSQSSSSNTSR